MIMNFSDCIEFANRIKTTYLATEEGDQPRVRPLLMWFADESGFYFQTQSVKALCKQLEKNNKIEFIFFDPDAYRVLRVSGEAEFIDDIETKKKALRERLFLKDMGITTPEDPLLAIFRVAKGEAYFWTRANTMKEADIPRIKFGK
jgi:pyridoxamine 5'-phosphate oxidase